MPAHIPRASGARRNLSEYSCSHWSTGDNRQITQDDPRRRCHFGLQFCASSFPCVSGVAAPAPLDLLPIVSHTYQWKFEASMPSSRFPIPQGTLDMLILQIVSLARTDLVCGPMTLG